MSDQSRTGILNKIAATTRKRVAAISVHKASNDNIYQPVLPDMINCFRSELEAINGKCIVCSNNELLIQQLKNLISEKQLSSIFCKDKEILNFLKNNDIKSVTVVRMEVPCCGGIEQAVKNALQASGKFIPWQVTTISIDGRILD